MGLVSFTEGDEPLRPGFRIGDRVVGLDTAPFSGPGRLNPHLAELETLERRAWDALTSNADPDVYRLAEVTLEQPVDPSKILRAEGCYQHDLTDTGFNPHLEAAELNELEWPSLWVTPRSTSVGPDSMVQLPRSVSDVRPGVEFAVVMGERIENRPVETVLDSVAGYVPAVTLTAHDELPGLEGYKMFEGFLAVGPSVVPADQVAPDEREMALRVNGDPLDVQTTADWRFTLAEILSHASAVMTLQPGDVVLTGNPIRAERTLSGGDRVSGRIDGVGSLSLTVVGTDDE